jgi:hypothetical protein
MTQTRDQRIAAKSRKMLIDFPVAVLEQIDALDSNRSRFVRQAVLLRIETIHQARINQELAEAYRANSEFALKICEEFMYADR